ncbi:MAG: YtxH domain-containing protein [Acidimicrobiia bacterium]
MDLDKLKDKAKDLVEDAKDKLEDVAQKVDDKAEDAAEKDGIMGKIGGAVHKVADKLDKD